MFYRQDLKGVVNAIKRQKPFFPPKHRPGSPPSPGLASDPVPGDQAKPSFDTKCLTVVVNVLVEQLKVLDWEGGGALVFKGPPSKNDLSCCRTDPAAQQSSGAQRARIQVQVIAG